MRNIVYFETKKEAEEYSKEHPCYSRLDYERTPFVDENGKKCHWTLTWAF